MLWRLRICLLIGMGLGSLMAQDAEDQEDGENREDVEEESIEPYREGEEEYVELKRFEVTGSRIRGFDVSEVSPITSIFSEEIEASGAVQVSELIRRMPVVAGSSEADQSLSFAGDGAQANLRGAGVGGTLVLLNGRRLSPYAFSTSSGNTFFDLNAIPFNALERFDVLRDGGSAIYGSDAIAGVINFVVRRDFDETELDVSYGNTTRDDDLSWFRVDLAHGEVGAKGSISVFAHHFQRNGLQLADREYSASADHSEEGGFNLLDWSSYPGLFEAETNVGTILFAGDATIAADDEYERFNFNEFQTALTEAERNGVSIFADRRLENGMTAIVELSVQDNRSVSQSAPAAFNRPFTIPGDHPNNPFLVFFGADIPISNVLLRPTDPDPRITTIRSDSIRFVSGIEGPFGANGRWEASYMFAESDIESTTENLIRVDLFQEALNQTEGLVLNPFVSAPGFGDNEEIYRSMMTDDTVRGKRELHALNLTASEELFQIDGRAVRGVAGLEFRTESMERRQSRLAEQFLLFGSGGTSAEGDRDLYAFFGEVTAPLTRKLEAHLALRHEEYSDFGGTTNPKVALKYSPLSGLLLRASVSEAFKAPSLEQAFGGITRGFRQEQDRLRLAYDVPNTLGGFEGEPYPFDDWSSREIRTLGNPDLDAETSEHYNFGVVYSPEFIDDFTVGLNAWRLDLQDRIAARSALAILQDEIDFFLEDQAAFINMDPDERGEITGVFRRPTQFNPDAAAIFVPGHILYIDSEYRNLEGFRLEGMDFELFYNHQTATRGNFVFRSFTSFFESFNISDFDLVGIARIPEFQTRNSLQWISSNRKWRAFAQSTYASQYKSIFTDLPKIGSHIVWDFSLAYNHLENWQLTLNVNNAFDRDPPASVEESEGYDENFGLHDPRGRMVAISFKKIF